MTQKPNPHDCGFVKGSSLIKFKAVTCEQRRFVRIFSKCVLLFVLFHTASAQDIRTNVRDGFIGRIEALSGGYVDEVARPGVSRLVFYRPSVDGQDNALSVFVNGMYHTSLIGQGYSDLCLSPRNVSLSARSMRVADGPKDGYESTMNVVVPQDGTQYFRVTHDRNRKPSLERVSATEALVELDRSKRQIHTISRVIDQSDCTPPREATTIELPADSFFEFARSDRQGLSLLGIATLESLATTLNNTYDEIEMIQVIGHADPPGNPSLNQALSEKRAETVAQLLKDKGVKAKRIEARGVGSTQPTVDCGAGMNASVIACNKRNRRVVLEVTGQPR